MKKVVFGLAFLLALTGCQKVDRNIDATDEDTIYSYQAIDGGLIITGFNDNYKNQDELIIPKTINKVNVIKIASKAFNKSYIIKSVDLSNSVVETIGSEAFANCDKLETIIFNDTLTTVDQQAFADCDKITEYNLGNTKIEEFSDGLFKNCESLTTVVAPASLKIVGSNAFDNCNKITSLSFENTNLEKISDSAFINMKGLAIVKLPRTLKTIGDNAFYNLHSLTTCDLTNTSIVSIGKSAFYKCEALKNIAFPNTLETLNEKSFYSCRKIEKLDLSNTKLTSIPESCFESCAELKSVTLPQLTSIKEFAFAYSGLTTIKLPKSLTDFSNDAFRNCTKLSGFDVEEGSTTLKSNDGVLYSADETKLIAYPIAKNIQAYTVLSSVNEICSFAFANVTDLINVNLANTNVSVINESTFMNCDHLQVVLLPNIDEIKSKAFYNCSNLTSFVADTHLHKIGANAFYGCSKLTTLNLTNKTSGVTEIESDAFNGCSLLDTIYLPVSITKIGRNAFSNCPKITQVCCDFTKAKWAEIDKTSSGLDTLDDSLFSFIS